jgi:hypothetical protein
VVSPYNSAVRRPDWYRENPASYSKIAARSITASRSTGGAFFSLFSKSRLHISGNGGTLKKGVNVFRGELHKRADFVAGQFPLAAQFVNGYNGTAQLFGGFFFCVENHKKPPLMVFMIPK